jgi:S-ribosylhomocysteine lyase
MRNTKNEDALEYIKNVIKECMNHQGEIPGSKKIECGNYLAHNAKLAHNSLEEFYNRIKELGVNDLFY